MVSVLCPTEECIKRDTKGMWRKAMNGEITGFTGHDDPYEYPSNPDVTVRTDLHSVSECVEQILKVYEEKSRVILHVGRWQPFHNGHKALIDEAIGEKRNIVIGVRETPRTVENPYDCYDIAAIIEMIYLEEPLVDVHMFPNVSSIRIGRNVGYSVDYVDLPEEIKGISATEIRQMIKDGDESWKEFVPEKVADLYDM
jgi:adenylylsulfate kinase